MNTYKKPKRAVIESPLFKIGTRFFTAKFTRFSLKPKFMAYNSRIAHEVGLSDFLSVWRGVGVKVPFRNAYGKSMLNRG